MSKKIMSVVLAAVLVMMAIPFSFGITASAALVSQQMPIKGIEGHWTTTGTYSQIGYNVGNTTFQGETVFGQVRNANANVGKLGDAELPNPQCPIYSYDRLLDVDGKPILAENGKYMQLTYYYDTKNVKEGLEASKIMEGRPMNFSVLNWCAGSGSTTATRGSNSVNSNTGVVCDQWDTLTFDCTKLLNYDEAVANGEAFRQIKLYTVTNENWGLPDFVEGEALYIKSVMFFGYDPEEVVRTERTVYFAADVDCADLGDYGDEIVSEDLGVIEFPDYDTKWLEDYGIADGAEFRGWVRLEYNEESEIVEGTVYKPGETFKLVDEQDEVFYAVYAMPATVEFVVGTNTYDTQYWKTDVTYTIPGIDEALIPDGQLFAGWVDEATGTIYRAGANYTCGGDAVFTAKFASAGTVYYAASGVIEGVDEAVYSTIEDAIAALADASYGTIYVSGDLTFNGAYDFSAVSSVAIKGYDDAATVTLCPSANSTYISGNDTEIIFDNIKIVRASGSNDENWFTITNGSLTFGAGCTFEQGIRTTNSAKMDLYLGAFSGNIGNVIYTFNSPEVAFAQAGSIVGWGNANTVTGNIKYIVNDGKFGAFYLTARNGRSEGGLATFSGNVDMIVNGGTFSSISTGSCNGGILNGNATLTVNGGTIGKIIISDAGINKDNTSKAGVTLVTVNYKDILDGGYTAPVVEAGKPIAARTATAVLFNNVELVEETDIPDLSEVADYTITVTEGKGTLVYDGGVKVSVKADDAASTKILLNGEAAKVENGFVTLNKGVNAITFAKEGDVNYLVKYVDNGDVGYQHSVVGGATASVKGANFIKKGYYVSGYEYNGKVYKVGETFTMPFEDVVFTAVWEEASGNWYVSNSGSDTANSGVSADSPFKTIARAMQAIGTEDGVIVVMDKVSDWPSNAFVGHIEVTGKDPATGIVYEAAAITRPSTRPTVSTNLTLSYIRDYIGAGAWNPINLSNAKFTIGEGVKTVDSDGKDQQPQVYFVNGSGNVSMTTSSPMLTCGICNWSDVTVSGDLTLNYLKGSSGKFYLAGDAGTKNTGKVTGHTFLLAEDTNGVTFYRGGDKAGSCGVFNGIQALFVNADGSNIVDHKYPDGALGSFVNNGPEYIVRAIGAAASGNVKHNGFGKISVTVPTGFKVLVGEDVYTADFDRDLTDGETVLEFTSLYDLVEDITIDGAQIRTEGEQGLRFIANYDIAAVAEKFDNVEEFGFVVLPTELLGGDKLIAGGKYTYNDATYDAGLVPAVKLFEEGEGYKKYTVCITGIAEENYTREYTVRTYVKLSSGDYVYGDQYATSVFDVAQAALDEGTEPQEVLDVLQGIVGAVLGGK